nr:uncharacterized protein LOC104113911 isoform X1 [Nicotiana tomentosiformis]
MSVYKYIRCRRFGHNTKACPFPPTLDLPISSYLSSPPKIDHTNFSITSQTSETPWQTVKFLIKSRIRNGKLSLSPQRPSPQYIMADHPSSLVNIHERRLAGTVPILSGHELYFWIMDTIANQQKCVKRFRFRFLHRYLRYTPKILNYCDYFCIIDDRGCKDFDTIIFAKLICNGVSDQECKEYCFTDIFN